MRQGELESELHDLDSELDQLAQQMRAFRLTHAILLGGRICLRSDGVEHAARLETEWLEFVRAHDRVIARRNATLEQMAGLKQRCEV